MADEARPSFLSILPPELREKIWAYLLQSFSLSLRDGFRQSILPPEHWHSPRLHRRFGFTAIFRVNRQMYHELASMFYRTRSIIFNLEPWSMAPTPVLLRQHGVLQGEDDVQLPRLCRKDVRILRKDPRRYQWLEAPSWRVLRQLPFHMFRRVEIYMPPMEEGNDGIEVLLTRRTVRRISDLLVEAHAAHSRIPEVWFVGHWHPWPLEIKRWMCESSMQLGQIRVTTTGGRMGAVLLPLREVARLVNIIVAAVEKNIVCFKRFLCPNLDLPLEPDDASNALRALQISPADVDIAFPLPLGRQWAALLDLALDSWPGEEAARLRYERFVYWEKVFSRADTELDIACCPEERRRELELALFDRQWRAMDFTQVPTSQQVSRTRRLAPWIGCQYWEL